MRQHLDSELSLQQDENQLNDISAKLAEIRRTLGIDISARKTPSESASPERNTNQNTFGKNFDSEVGTTGQKALIALSNDYPIRQSPSIQSPEKSRGQIGLMQSQIEHLQDRIEQMRQLYPEPVEVSQYANRENEYLRVELEIKNKQNSLLKQQIQKLEEQYLQENDNLRNEVKHTNIQLSQLKAIHEEYIDSTDLQGDLKQYIISLETDLFLTKQELTMMVTRLAEEQEKNETQKQELQTLESRVYKNLEHLFQRQVKELGYICLSLSAEVMQPHLPEQQSKLQKLYQDLLDEKFMLEDKIEQMTQPKDISPNTLKTIYENRLQTMKAAVLLWKNRGIAVKLKKAQQVEQIVGQWFRKVRDENSNLRRELLSKQAKMFKVFEDLIKQIHSTFNDDKARMLEHIKQLQIQNSNMRSRLRVHKSKK